MDEGAEPALNEFARQQDGMNLAPYAMKFCRIGSARRRARIGCVRHDQSPGAHQGQLLADGLFRVGDMLQHMAGIHGVEGLRCRRRLGGDFNAQTPPELRPRTGQLEPLGIEPSLAELIGRIASIRTVIQEARPLPQPQRPQDFHMITEVLG